MNDPGMERFDIVGVRRLSHAAAHYGNQMEIFGNKNISQIQFSKSVLIFVRHEALQVLFNFGTLDGVGLQATSINEEQKIMKSTIVTFVLITFTGGNN
jgi:hypothetical protein